MLGYRRISQETSYHCGTYSLRCLVGCVLVRLLFSLFLCFFFVLFLVGYATILSIEQDSSVLEYSVHFARDDERRAEQSTEKRDLHQLLHTTANFLT